jgi:uncharacterized protein
MTTPLAEYSERMLIEWDVPVPMDDGLTLRCDVFRPNSSAVVPTILSYGPYGKWVHFEDGYPIPWALATRDNPGFFERSSNRLQNFEVVDPEIFVPKGYAVVRVDGRGSGRSPGFLDPWSAREAHDIYEAIEWCAAQPWSNGRVGLSGTSYLAMNQWQAAALKPPHLSAICVWEGAADIYRDMVRHGGILCEFGRLWYEAGVLPVQHGRGSNGLRSRVTGDWVSGPDTLDDQTLTANRVDWHQECQRRQLVTDEYWRSRIPDLSAIDVPVLSTANWGGQGLHLRGSIEGFLAVGSKHKWLEIHCHNHWYEYYTEYGIELQSRFFDRFLKDEANDWSDQPRIHMQVRSPGEQFRWRGEYQWPLARTDWQTHYLNASDLSLQARAPGAADTVDYGGQSAGVTFLGPPMAHDTEITGPIAARLFVSTETSDVDVFLVVRVFAPDMHEVTFKGHIDPHTPVAQGWLRASHRKLDQQRSLPYRPFHAHDEVQPLSPGEVYELHVEILPTCVVIPAGYRLGLSVRGKDYEHAAAGMAQGGERTRFTGVGQFRHNDPEDRPSQIVAGTVTLHCGPAHPSSILLPVVPADPAHV